MSSNSEWRFVMPPAPASPSTRSDRLTFSVIVATYNLADIVGEALSSAFAQTEPPMR